MYNITERLIRVFIFIIFNFIIIKYILDIKLSDNNLVMIILTSLFCFMFVNTYYPVIITK